MTTWAGGPRRNLLFITTDQERWFHDDPVPLPAHSRLRDTGTSFDRFYAASIACSAARSVMYTGEHVTTTGVIDNVGMPGQPSMSAAIPTLATHLGRLGYVTAFKGKWHLSTEALPQHATGPLSDALVPYGFVDYNDVGDDLGGPYEGFGSDGRIAHDVVQWLSERGAALAAHGTPWCLSVNFINPHDIMWATRDPRVLQANTTPPPGRKGFTGPPDTGLYAQRWGLPDDPTWDDTIDAQRPAAHVQFDIANRIFLGKAVDGKDDLRWFREYYLNCLLDVDRQVERVLDGLDAAGLADDTVIVYTSDHGELAGAHGLVGKGPCSYDENLRLPLIIVDPSRPGGGRVQALSSQVDLVPTLVALAAGSTEVGVTGRDLSPAFDAPDDATVVRDHALFVYDGLIFIDGEWALRTYAGMRADDQVTGRDFSARGLMRTMVGERYKFTRYFAPGEHHVPGSFAELLTRNTLELFDLHTDPHERSNLALDAAHHDLMWDLTVRMNALIANELGPDDGHWLPAFPGAPWL